MLNVRFKLKKLIITLTLTVLVFLTAGTVHAKTITQDLTAQITIDELITRTFTGQITMAAENNVFGVAVNDTVSWTTTYDMNAYRLDDHSLVIGEDSAYNLDVTIGNRTFDETEDEMYGPGNFGSPILYFAEDDVSIIGVSFLVIDSINGYRFDAFNNSFDIFELDSNGKMGSVFVKGTLGLAEVPIPSAVLLFAAGLAGLSRKNS
ncbi:MAG: hypothetical protein CSA25_06260 [Desulfobacter postgatei]|uniref:PEP-CTERM sorting domain-containing protein n=1 Tax=Desulfobacter postgatei TaxID=2293 RepID=A0A2G6MQJ0_9BACT|nr:MAG: hypothetical protein CSA25_06260 [Desulfobacter postgatei]